MVEKEKRGKWEHIHNVYGGGGALYGLGVIGALFYFLQNVSNIQDVIVGIFKAIFWPSFVVFKVLELLRL